MSTIDPISVSTIADEALKRVTQAIVSGQYAPGERLSEAELARQFGISRGPIREALGRLEGKLVQRSPRVGVSVLDLSIEKLTDLFAVREALEGMAARLAATNITDADIEHLTTLLDRHSGHRDVSAGEGYYQGSKDDDFHFNIARIAGNNQLQHMLQEELYHQLRLYRYRLSVRKGRALTALDEHRAILAALSDRNPDRAEEAMRTHIRNAISEYSQAMISS